MDCTLFNASAIRSLDSQPYDEIYSTVTQCPDICKIVYGIGDLDLTGIGVSGLFHFLEHNALPL